eukprot:CAMPEP_0181319824 /NCGR_PEP_ID=MMETSP1101-20121128/17784_1 /TAXON_ID=46948 /ORGANISM="Rhodomonas abbreviata, Strain Caron Lab Isolate" /LENGTH=191 /DNA_ID=CAMNT_0023427463 /DNA_START=13 /DNA_END=588 /DNA_ORIENTATION=+
MAAVNVAGTAFSELPPGLVTSSLASFALRAILTPDEQSASLEELTPPGASSADMKTAVAGLTSVLLESAKQDLSAQDFRAVLQDSGIGLEDAEKVANEYETSKASLRRLLGRTQFSLPNLVGIKWRLDHVVKSKNLSHLNQPVFMLRFNIIQSNGQEEPLEVTCSEEHLRELYSTLTQATHQVNSTLKQLS